MLTYKYMFMCGSSVQLKECVDRCCHQDAQMVSVA